MFASSTLHRWDKSHHPDRSHRMLRQSRVDRWLAWLMLALILASMVLMAWAMARLSPQAGLPFPYELLP